MQRVHSLPVVALLASVWSMLMFFPNLDLGEYAGCRCRVWDGAGAAEFPVQLCQLAAWTGGQLFLPDDRWSMLLLVPTLVKF